jgi:hypothetical protein
MTTAPFTGLSGIGIPPVDTIGTTPQPLHSGGRFGTITTMTVAALLHPSVPVDPDFITSSFIAEPTRACVLARRSEGRVP